MAQKVIQFERPRGLARHWRCSAFALASVMPATIAIYWNLRLPLTSKIELALVELVVFLAPVLFREWIWSRTRCDLSTAQIDNLAACANDVVVGKNDRLGVLDSTAEPPTFSAAYLL